MEHIEADNDREHQTCTDWGHPNGTYWDPHLMTENVKHAQTETSTLMEHIEVDA